MVSKAEAQRRALSPPAQRRTHVGAEMPDSNVSDKKNIERDWCPQHAHTLNDVPPATATDMHTSGHSPDSQDTINPPTPLHPPSTRLTHSHLDSTQHHKTVHGKTAMQIYKTAFLCQAPTHTPAGRRLRTVDALQGQAQGRMTDSIAHTRMQCRDRGP